MQPVVFRRWSDKSASDCLIKKQEHCCLEKGKRQNHIWQSRHKVELYFHYYHHCFTTESVDLTFCVMILIIFILPFTNVFLSLCFTLWLEKLCCLSGMKSWLKMLRNVNNNGIHVSFMTSESLRSASINLLFDLPQRYGFFLFFFLDFYIIAIFDYTSPWVPWATYITHTKTHTLVNEKVFFGI